MRRLANGRGASAAVQVPQVSLARIFAEHAPPEGVDFLKVDVEGWEAEVLASADWERDRPPVVLVEAVDAEGRPTHDEWEPILSAAGYRFALFDGLNRFYCRNEDVDEFLPRLAAPANVLDHWRPLRDLRIAAKLGAVEGELERTQRALAAERHALAAERHALAAEQQAHEDTRHMLTIVYDSTSWRITAPIRDASRLWKLVRQRRDT